MLCDVEQQILDALPGLARKATNDELRAALEEHRHQTGDHLSRVQDLCRGIGVQPGGRAAEGLRAEIRDVQTKMEDIEDENALDAYIIAVAQGVEHFEIAAYGTARSWARHLGRTDDAIELERTLREEEGTDELLTDIAERTVNDAAAHAGR
jgi:ferritin-like metal-binding protein YciE